MAEARDKTHAPKERDAYMTIDTRVVPALTKHVFLRGLVWECAAGDFHMSTALMEAGREVFSSDIYDYGLGQKIIDFLATDKLPDTLMRSIVTNPPNKLNIAFARHALKLLEPVNGLLALYQRHEWDTTQRTAGIFNHPAFAAKITCRFRPRWFKPEPGKKPVSPFHRWSWYVWDYSHRGAPIMRFS